MPTSAPEQTPAPRGAGRARVTAAAEDRRQRILDATLQVIAEGGVDAVSHRRVATLAGVPLGSTTYYFESRAHLIREAFAAHLARSRQLMARDTAQEPVDIDDAVDRVCATLDREFADRDRLLAEYEMTLFAARDPALAELLRGFDTAITDRLIEPFRAFGIPDPQAAARSVLQILRGHQLDQLVHGDAATDDLKRRLRALLRGLAPDDPQPAED